MAGFTAFYVLYPSELRNLLMHLALIGLFSAKWPADVHEEWISNLLKKRPDRARDELERTRMLMDKHAVDALVTGYEDLIPGLQLPDPDDRHVLAAAIRGHADVVEGVSFRPAIEHGARENQNSWSRTAARLLYRFQTAPPFGSPIPFLRR